MASPIAWSAVDQAGPGAHSSPVARPSADASGGGCCLRFRGCPSRTITSAPHSFGRSLASRPSPNLAPVKRIKASDWESPDPASVELRGFLPRIRLPGTPDAVRPRRSDRSRSSARRIAGPRTDLVSNLVKFERPAGVTTSAGRNPASPGPHSRPRRLTAPRESSGAPAVRPRGRPVPGCAPVPVLFGEERREGCPPGPPAASPRARPRAGPATFTRGLRLSPGIDFAMAPREGPSSVSSFIEVLIHENIKADSRDAGHHRIRPHRWNPPVPQPELGAEFRAGPQAQGDTAF
jgi:hypothetical protein